MGMKKYDKVSSLLAISSHYIVNNLHLYEDSHLQSIEILPVNIKNKLLKIFTSTSYYSKNVEFTKFLKVFVNKTTTHINLTAVLITNEMLEILSVCNNLKGLHLTMDGSNCKITSEGLMRLLHYTPKLEYLAIMRSDIVNDEVLECVVKNCPKLEGLDIGGCINVSDKGLRWLKDTTIRWLRISWTQITDEGITTLVEGKCGQTLEEIMIDNCVEVTHIGINKISQCCPKLNILNFLNCSPDISTTDVFNFKQPLKQMFWQISFYHREV